jgi:tRNA-dihydrouridine synthase B
MVGRGALGNPWIFRDIIGYLASGETFSITTLKEREDTIREHLDMNVRYFGKVMGVKNFRKHILWYTKGLKRSAEFRQMVVSIDERKDLLETVHRYFALLSEFD